MSHWNYRLIAKEYTHGSGEVEVYVEVHEVYYRDDGSIRAYSAEPMSPHGSGLSEREALGEILGDLDHMLQATKRPVIKLEELKQEVKKNGDVW